MLRRPLPLLSLVCGTLLFSSALTISLRAAPVRWVQTSVERAQPAAGSASFTGPGSCAAAACHGSVRPVAGSRILQTEYSTWAAQDRHARATDVLSNVVSQRIGKILNIGAPATASKCLACHGLDVPERQQARSFENEGVSCEACHGPASGWLGPHTTRNWTHAQSVQLGMHDTKDLVKRTERCLTCHLGTADKFVDHEMIAAGHPDLVFDLETYSAAMPRHWRVPTGTDPFASVRSFAVGQLVHVRSAVDRLAAHVRKPGWPDYSELDCFACHHNLTRPEDSWRQAQGFDNRRPGTPPLNQSRWTTGRRVLAAYDAPAADELDVVMTKLAAAAARGGAGSDQAAPLAAQARTLLDRAVARALTTQPDAAFTTRLLHAIAADAGEIAPRGERAAEQAAMALDTLYSATSGGPGGESAAVRAAFDELFQQFQSPSTYDPRRFVAQVRKIEDAVR